MTGGAGYLADATATCRHRLGHDAPDPGCTCGFHALSSDVARDQMIAYLRVRQAGRGIAALSVALSGRVLAFEWARRRSPLAGGAADRGPHPAVGPARSGTGRHQHAQFRRHNAPPPG
jgi:hypothetical protein